MSYRSDLNAVLTVDERKLITKLSTPSKVQDYLDSIAVNTSKIGASIQSPHQVLTTQKAHCIEAAIFAAAVFAYHGRPGYLLDLRAGITDEDHVVALFKEDGLWGAVSKTNHPQLRYRDPVYKSVRELTMSYFNEYFLFDATHFSKKVAQKDKGLKTLREYSKPFDITRFPAASVWSAEELDWLAEKLDDSMHLPTVPRSVIKKLRHASAVEIESAKLKEWVKGKRKN